MSTRFFKVAPTMVNDTQVILLWLDSKYMNDQEEIKAHVRFFKEKQECQNIVVMILDETEHPVYFGKKELIDTLKKYVWKKFPWQTYGLEAN